MNNISHLKMRIRQWTPGMVEVGAGVGAGVVDQYSKVDGQRL
jgi:hypothetical protein